MASFGNKVSRTLSPELRQFIASVFQADNPPLDSEMNLAQQIQWEAMSQTVRQYMHSGFLVDPVFTEGDYQFDPDWSNQLVVGTQAVGETNPSLWASINGWVLPIAGTQQTTAGDVTNRVRLNPPPTSGTRTDLVFVEAWLALVQPNPATTNKPSASEIWTYGNVEYGQTNVTDDLIDGSMGFETTRRVQLQYRIRVMGANSTGVDLTTYPDGLEDPNVLGQGSATTPQGGFTFENMRDTLGDPGLWRSGDGDPDNALGTVDGYVYAIPLCAVSRRNSASWSAISLAGNPNNNGSFNRNPSASLLSNPRDGAKAFTALTLTAALDGDTTGVVSVTGLTDSGFDDPSHTFPLFARIREEVIEISSVDTGAGTITIASRGRGGTQATYHLASTQIVFYTSRADGLFSDQIGPSDILDLRHVVTPGQWDYQQILASNLSKLLKNDLRTSPKQSGTGDEFGVRVGEISLMHADGSVAALNQTDAVDGPDGIRTIFSDAATIQTDVTLLLDPDAPLTGGFTTDQFDATATWDVGADFKPTGFLNNLGAGGSWTNGSSIFLHIGGDAGTEGARATFRDGSTRAVRFLTPQEAWKNNLNDPQDGRQSPVTLRFLDQYAHHPEAPGESNGTITEDIAVQYRHPGPYYPLTRAYLWEHPFIVLGGVLHSSLRVSGLTSDSHATAISSTGTITVDTQPSALDTVTINGTVLTATAGAPGANEFQIGADVNATATNLASAINTYVSSAVSAVPAANVVTLTANPANFLGTAGDAITLVSSVPAVLIVSGPTLSGGVDPLPGLVEASASASGEPEIDLGINFDTAGGFYSFLTGTSEFANDPSLVSSPLAGGRRTLFDMLTNGRRHTTGLYSEVYIVLYGDTASQDNNGVFQVIGAGTVGYTDYNATNSTSVVVRPLSAGVSDFAVAPGQTLSAEIRSQHTYVEDGSGFASGDASLAIVLTDIQGTNNLTGNAGNNPWSSTNLGAYAIPASVSSKLQVNCTLQYSPGRSAMSRVPEDIWRVAVKNGGSTYLRQALGSRDSSFVSSVGLPSDETFYEPEQISIWNRLPSRGLTESTYPKAPNFGGNIVSFSEQDRETEAFFDRGSKTLLFRPFQDKAMTLQGITTAADPRLWGSLTYGVSGVFKDQAGIFTTGGLMGFPVPSEWMPRFGRQDIPYYEDVAGTGAGTFLEGINHLFTDSTDPTEPQFYIIGGQDNTTGGNQVTPMFFQTGSTSGHIYGVYGTIAGPATPAYQARLTSDIGTATSLAEELTVRLQSVQSSDFGTGLEGIQLPPYHGVARVYGIYDRADFIAKGGLTYAADRVTLSADPPTNLLRKDATKQTLFIFQDGAQDVTGGTGDHTYIIPSNAIDHTRSPYYTEGDAFSDFEYVVECVVFGFAKDWINKNNYVLARRHNGQGTLIADGADPELEGARMTIPAPAVLNDRMYVGYSRTPYQGDPYMSRAGTTRVVSDYEARYGQVALSDALELATPIQQFDSAGVFQPETPNVRPFEVLASVDFYTTIGTGKMGGEIYPGTVLDVGYTEFDANTRIPASASDPQWQTVPRAFTEGQRRSNARAFARLDLNEFGADLVGWEVELFWEGDTLSNQVDTTTARLWATEGKKLCTLTGVSGAPANENQFQADLASVQQTALFLGNAITTHSALYSLFVYAEYGTFRGSGTDGTVSITLYSTPTGEVGKNLKVRVKRPNPAGSSNVYDMAVINFPDGTYPPLFYLNREANFGGVVDIPFNGGVGRTQIQLAGLSERLPLGILLQDHDFLGEDILNNGASALVARIGANQPLQTLLPLTQQGNGYDRFQGAPGEQIALSDGSILEYEAYHETTAPTGTKKFRLYRGGGSMFMLSGDNPGGPVEWIADSFASSQQPVLKGGVLAGKALLVRNYREEAFAANDTTTYGDEVQMIIATYGIVGDGETRDNGLQLDGLISPTGFGEGYAAADRYRCVGRPLHHSRSRTIQDPANVTLAIFPGREE